MNALAPITTAAGLDLRATFARDGYLILPGFADSDMLARLQTATQAELAAKRPPLEYESANDYAGRQVQADEFSDSQSIQPTGTTVRRLLEAFGRDDIFAEWAKSPALLAIMQTLLGEQLLLVQNHHNCIMTKHPQGGTRTGWHRDTRYWHYTRPELVNAWLALDAESPDNGGLRIIPGSHVIEFEPDRLDDALFLRDDERNQELIAKALPLTLQPGDLLLFHSHLLHAAGANRTDQIKHSLVFTYRAADNPPLPGTRSMRLPDIALN